MQAYDLHVHSAFSGGESSLVELASTAKLLGYKGIGFVSYWQGSRQFEILQAEIQKTAKEVCIEIYLGFEARNISELGKLAKLRRLYDLLLVRGGNLRLNRAAVETPEVDILTHPEFGRTDSGLNHVLARLAAKNRVAIELNFREILISNARSRAVVLKHMRRNATLAKKYGAPIIVCSGTVSHWYLKDPYIMVSMATQVGLNLEEAKQAITEIPKRIIKLARERRSKRWVMPGVKIV